jgi:hypothetical protein
MLWPWLLQLLGGYSVKAAAEKLNLPFALETFYRVRRKLSQGLERLRTCLHREQAPPESPQTDPLLQTIAHLKRVFPDSQCSPADFQFHFQTPFLG